MEDDQEAVKGVGKMRRTRGCRRQRLTRVFLCCLQAKGGDGDDGNDGRRCPH